MVVGRFFVDRVSCLTFELKDDEPDVFMACDDETLTREPSNVFVSCFRPETNCGCNEDCK